MSAATSPASLLRGSRLSREPVPKPTYPAPRPPLSESPWSLLPAGACARAPRPTLCMLHLIRLLFSLVSLTYARAAYLACLSSPRSVSLVGACIRACRLYSTITITNEYNYYTFLVAIDSFSSARTSPIASTTQQASERVPCKSLCQLLSVSLACRLAYTPTATCAHEPV